MCPGIAVQLTRDNLPNDADFGERMGDFCLGLLRLSFGKTVTIMRIDSHEVVFENEKVSKIERKDRIVFVIRKIESVVKKVFAGVEFFLELPITLTLAGIGLVSIACSKSFQKYIKQYANFHPNAIAQEKRRPKLSGRDIDDRFTLTKSH